jgi:predicted O-methyltransferase YrrM
LRATKLIRKLQATVLEREAVAKERQQRIVELEKLLAGQRAAPRDRARGATLSADEFLSAKILAALPAIEGWCTERKAVWLAGLITANRCIRVLAIGIFGGKSLIPMALAVREQAPDGKVYGVEAWSNEVAIATATNADNDAWWRNVEMDAIKAGFWRNVLDNELAGFVNVLEMSSDEAFKCIAAIGLEDFDLIHIDGAHSEVQALRDVKTWTPLLRPGGILVMDEISWPTVQPAREHLKASLSVIDEVFEPDGSAYGAYRRPG